MLHTGTVFLLRDVTLAELYVDFELPGVVGFCAGAISAAHEVMCCGFELSEVHWIFWKQSYN